MMHPLLQAASAELQKRGTALERRVLLALGSALGALADRKRDEFRRVLPVGDYLVDRWDKARYLGFGAGSSIYDCAVVLGDVKVGKDTWIGPFSVLDGVGGLEIGDHCSISAGVQIYTHDSVAWAVDNREIDRAPVRIGSNVYIGPNSIIARGVTIGDRAVVGANSLVLSDVASNTKVAGNPARIVGTT